MDDELIEKLVSKICVQDGAYWDNQEKHHFSRKYRRNKRKLLREFRKKMRAEQKRAEA